MFTAAELKTLLRTHGLRLTKRLGQHHLIDHGVIQQLVDRSQVSSSDVILEIGSGLGALTEPLALRASHVLAVEVDRGICSLLSQRLAPLVKAGRLSVRCEDILQFSWDGMKDVVVIGAIPYHITSPILVALCEQRDLIRRAILIVQEEVAQRLLAKPGTKSYGRLSILVQYGWEVSRLLAVPRRAFFPQPRVDSSCVRFIRRGSPPAILANEPLFFAIVKAAFSHRRKTLVNCLTSEPSLRIARPQAEALLRRVGLPASVRGETLSLAQFAALANALVRETPFRVKE